jgi:hypothetical protein
MGKVYVIRKNLSLTSSPSGIGTQFNLDNKPLTEDEYSSLGRFGQMGANFATRYAAPFTAAYSALSTLADDSQDDGLSALGRAGMAGIQNYSLTGGYGQRAGAKVGSQIDRMAPYLSRFKNSIFNNTTSVASPNASTGDDSMSLVDDSSTAPNPVEAANARLDAISSEEAKEALKDQNAEAPKPNEDVETMGGLRRDNVKVIGRQ